MVINPEFEAAREISSILSLPSTLEVSSFAHGQAELVEFKIEEGNVLDGLTIKDLSSAITSKVLITAVKRGNDVVIPTGDFVLHADDIVSAVGARRFARTFLSEIGFKTRQVKDCLIVGGGKASFYLAKLLLQARINVRIIERNKERCEELSIALPKATIIKTPKPSPDTPKPSMPEAVKNLIKNRVDELADEIFTLSSKLEECKSEIMALEQYLKENDS